MASNTYAGDSLSLALRHLQKHGLSTKNVYLEQQTASSDLYLSEYTLDRNGHPCHTAVVVNRKSKKIINANQDPDLSFYYPYTDIFPDPGRLLVHICAD